MAQEDTSVFTLQLSGALDQHTVPDLWSKRSELLSETVAPVCIDLQAVEHTDTSGLAFMTNLQAEAMARGQSLTFINLPQQMQALVSVSSLEEVLSLG